MRPLAHDGPVDTLYLEAHPVMTERGIETAIENARARWPLQSARIIHRIGTMKPGDAIVFVATSAKHRRSAFLAADYLMDYLKTEAVFWKKESGPGGAKWIEPRTEDYEDGARWTMTESQ